MYTYFVKPLNPRNVTYSSECSVFLASSICSQQTAEVKGHTLPTSLSGREEPNTFTLTQPDDCDPVLMGHPTQTSRNTQRLNINTHKSNSVSEQLHTETRSKFTPKTQKFPRKQGNFWVWKNEHFLEKNWN